MRTAEAMTPFLTARAVTISFAVFVAIYTLIFAFGVYYIYRLLRAGPSGERLQEPTGAVPNRPISVVARPATAGAVYARGGE